METNRKEELEGRRSEKRPSDGSGRRGTATKSRAEIESSRLGSAAREYLTDPEAAALLRITPKTLRNKIACGLFDDGVHFHKRRGLRRRWKRDALVRWLEGGESEPVDVFPLAQPGGRKVG